MAKQLNVNLAFQADTSQAKKNLQDLQQSLNKIASMSWGNKIPLTDNLKEASLAANDLQKHINAAFNTTTGNIDLSKFSASLKSSNQTLAGLSSSLLKAGMDGEQSFLRIHKAISSANISLTKQQTLLGQFATTLANTARWQLSSSVLHGFMGALQGAYGYAQDLNESLNNIRIVTGQNTEQMAKFAKEANRAAQELGTTTTKYTDAALIYYQQGLGDEKVKERTDVTMKMSNVAKEDATTVSSYMTAIWNNFNKAGDESAEHFADVLTKLGASTAASTAEIANGLQKFASVADTIGLSYDYASSALATIIDKTRQSEDVVGTSLRTIFARIQGLNLGETAEDGTTLNKYSTALAKVGVSVKDSNGELREMDDILDDLGVKWQTLDKATQTALAQTVAGVRQYTQLVALMDNWDAFKQNVTIAEGSDGELEKQAQIYEESWEAASKKVKAAAEDIYGSLLDDKFFIGLNNSFAGLLKTIGTITDSMGGFKGVVLLTSSILMSRFQPELSKSLDAGLLKISQLKTNLQTLNSELKSGSSGKGFFATLTDGMDKLPDMMQQEKDALSRIKDLNIPLTEGFRSQVNSLTKINGLNEEIYRNRKNLTDTERELLELGLKQAQALSEQVAASKQKVSDLRFEAEQSRDDVAANGGDLGAVDWEYGADGRSGYQARINIAEQEYAVTKKIATEAKNLLGIDFEREKNRKILIEDNTIIVKKASDLAEAQRKLLSIRQSEGEVAAEVLGILNNENMSNADRLKMVDEYLHKLRDSDNEAASFAKSLLKGTQITDDLKQYTEQIQKNLSNHTIKINKIADLLGISSKKMQEMFGIGQQINREEKAAAEEAGQMNLQLENTKKSFSEMVQRSQSFGANLTKTIQGVSQVFFAFQTIKSSIDQLKDPDVDWTQKLASGAMLATGAVTVLTGAMKLISSVTGAYTAVSLGLNAAKERELALSAMLRLAAHEEVLGHNSVMRAKLIEIAAKRLGLKTEEATIVVEKVLEAIRNREPGVSAKAAAAEALHTLMKKYGNAETEKAIALTSILNLKLLAIIIVIAAVAGAIYLIVKAVKKAQENSPEKQLERAKTRAQEASKAFDELSASVNETAEAFKNLHEQEDILKDMTKGTDEWQAQLLKVNDAVLDIAETYGLIAKYDKETGQYYIDEKDEANRLAENNRKLLAAQNARIMAQTETERKQYEVDRNNAVNATNSDVVSRMEKVLAENPDLFEGNNLEEQARRELDTGNGRFGKIANSTGLEKRTEMYYDAVGEEEKEEAIQEWMQAYRDLYDFQAARGDGNFDVTEQLQQSHLNAIGSTRDISEVRFDYSKQLEEAQQEYLSRVETVDKNNKEVNDYLELQNKSAEGLKRVSKDANGNIKYEFEDSQNDFSVSEQNLANSLAEQQVGSDFETEATEAAQKRIRAIIHNAAAQDLDGEAAIIWDNIYAGLQKIKPPAEATNILNGVFETADGDIESLTEKLNHVVWNEDTIAQAYEMSQNLEMSGTEAEKLADAMARMDAAAQLDQMEDTFKDAAETYGLDADQATAMQDYAKYLMDVADEEEIATEKSEQLADSLTKDADTVSRLSINATRLNQGIEDLSSGFEKWNLVLSDANAKNTKEYAEALSSLRAAMANLLNVSGDVLSNNFLTSAENLELMAKAAEGDAEAIDALAEAANRDIAIQANFNYDAFMQQFNQFLLDYEGVQSLDDIEIGARLDDTQFVSALQQMVELSGMTAEQTQAFLGNMGVDAQIVTETTEQPTTTTYTGAQADVTYVDVPGVNPMNSEPTVYRVPSVSYTATPKTEVGDVTQATGVSIKTTSGGVSSGGKIDWSSLTKKAPTKSAINKSNTPSGKSSGSSGSSGGSSSPAKNQKTTAKDDVVERYKEINDKLDDLADAMSDANKQADRLWGKDRLAKMQQQGKLLQKEIDLNKEKLRQAKEYLKVDRAALDKAAAEVGVNFNIDSNGLISNYTSEMEKLFAQYNAVEAKWANASNWGSSDEQSQYNEQVVAPLKEKIDALKSAISKFDETRELMEDLENTIDDAFNNWQDNNYDIIHQTLELDLEINDQDLKLLDYYVNKLSDDFYSLAEALGFMTAKVPSWQKELGAYNDQYESLIKGYENGEISQAKFIEGLKDTFEGVMNLEESLNDLDKSMLHYYEDTLSKGNEELAKQLDQMKHLTTVLDHYQKIVNLVNGEYDYDRIGEILNGMASTKKDQLDVLEANYQMLLRERDAILAQMAAVEEGSAEWEVYNKELEAVTKATNQAEEDMLAATEEWAEAMKAVMENTFTKAARDMEMAFTNGLGFDYLNKSMDRMQKHQDEYLTKTNQLYETQKLMRKAQQDADKTTNEAAKARIANFMKETEELQNKTQLSNYELKVQQAKYNLLLAQIALEEAQNAKSTVRLQRDTEGNFGYVYTADQNKVNDAEQAVADAENDLYNIGLEAANEYGQKVIELQQQFTEEMLQLEQDRANGLFATDEAYEEAKKQLIEEYTKLFEDYSFIYTEALGTHAEVANDYWMKSYADIIDNAENWKDQSNDFLLESEGAFENYTASLTEKNITIKTVLEDTKQAVEEVQQASEDLKNHTLEEVLPAIEQEYQEVRQATSDYAKEREKILELIKTYENLMKSINQIITAQYNLTTSIKDTAQAIIDAARAAANNPIKIHTEYSYSGSSGPGSDGSGNGNNGYIGTGGDYINTRTNPYSGLVRNGGSNQGGSNNRNYNTIGAFATGGYTGDWDNTGRLAVLHQKELVLNKDDTANFLASVDVVREIARKIDIDTMDSLINSAPVSFGRIAEKGIPTNPVQQDVRIEATFPGVKDRNEIEEALNNLVNRASQYVNRKDR